MIRVTLPIAACVAIVLAACPAAAQSTPVAVEAAVRASEAGWPVSPDVILRVNGTLTVRATRVREAITMDGRLDDPVYAEVRPVSDFVQQEPHEGAPATEKTEAWVLFDDDNIYVACRCWDTHPERIVANDMRRDSSNLRQHDNFGVGARYLPRPPQRLPVLGLAGRRHSTTARSATSERSTCDWNTVVDAKVGRFEGGWIAEIAIPFKSLRYGPGREQIWGINFRRTIRAKNEHSYLTPIRPHGVGTAIARFSAAATLVGLEAPPRGDEPRDQAVRHRGPYDRSGLGARRVRNDVDPDAGFDVKYGLTKSLTADFTYNTDFAQVEADEAQVNLTRFSLSFPEKREFFLEGQGIIRVSAARGGADDPTIFYSRRIGLSGAGRCRSSPAAG